MSSIAGARILVPVTANRRALAERLRTAGAAVTEVEFIAVVESSTPGRLREATVAWCDGSYDWLAVTSRNAVGAMEAIARGAGRSLGEPQPRAMVATVGEATSAACAAAGLHINLLPRERHDARGIVAEFPDGPGTVVVPAGDLASPVLARGLERKGWTVTTVEAYRVVDGPGISAEVAQQLAGGGFDAVLLTSGSVAERYAPHAPPAEADTLVVAIGKTTEAAARATGVRPHAVSTVPSYDGIVAALESAWNDKEVP